LLKQKHRRRKDKIKYKHLVKKTAERLFFLFVTSEKNQKEIFSADFFSDMESK
jgi:hypothetical protein